MTRSATVLAMCAVLVGGVAWADEDAIGAKLAVAKTEYEKSLGKARDGLLADLKKKADVAQKAGDLKALEKIEDEVKAFEDKGTLPKLVSTRDFTDATRVARARLITAYMEAVKEYTKAGMVPLAKAAQATLEDLKKETGVDAAKDKVSDDSLPVGTKLVGTCKWSSGPPEKRVSDAYKMEFTVTKRSGKEITIGNPGGWVHEGTIVANGSIKLRCTGARNDQRQHVDNTFLNGAFDKSKDTLTLTGGMKSDSTFQIEFKLKIETK